MTNHFAHDDVPLTLAISTCMSGDNAIFKIFYVYLQLHHLDQWKENIYCKNFWYPRYNQSPNTKYHWTSLIFLFLSKIIVYF